MSRGIASQIRALLLEGISYRSIAKQLECSKGTIAAHAKRMKNPKKKWQEKYDWKYLQECYDAGETVEQLSKRFGFTPTVWAAAVKSGLVVKTVIARDRKTGIRNRSLQECFIVHEKRYGNQQLKKRMIKAGLLKDECYVCGCDPIWRDLPLVLRLDHINGDNRDCREGNLRLVCPNCDSQLPTFTGRNTVNKRKLQLVEDGKAA
jgi:hypothetical protein